MKKPFFLVIAVLSCVCTLAQSITLPPKDVSAALRVQSRVCESDQEMQIQYDQYYGFGGIGTTDYYYAPNSQTDCDRSRWVQVDRIENSSLKWEDESGNILPINSGDRTIAYVIPKKTGVYRVSWKNTTYFAASQCTPAYSETQEYFGTTNRVVVIPKAKSPRLTVDKNTVESGSKAAPAGGNVAKEEIKLTCLDCPESTSDYTFSYQFYRAVGECYPPTDETAYSTIGVSHINTFVTSLDYDTKYYYKVQCYTSECPYQPISNDPVVVRGIVTPVVPAPNCNQGERTSFDEQRADFHHYNVSQDVCDKSDPNCSVQKIFELLQSKQKLSVPQYEDFTDFYNNLAEVGSSAIDGITHIKPFILASKGGVDYYQRNTATEHCLKTGVYTPASYAFVVKLFPAAFHCLDIQNRALFWDPITQGIDNNTKTITNYTLPGHFLYPGKVMIAVKEDICKVFVQITGMGNSGIFECNEAFGIEMSTKINVDAGLVGFSNLISRLKEYYNSNEWR